MAFRLCLFGRSDDQRVHEMMGALKEWSLFDIGSFLAMRWISWDHPRRRLSRLRQFDSTDIAPSTSR